MKNFLQLDFPPVNGVFECLADMLNKGIIDYGYEHQICINTVEGKEHDYTIGRGSLIYDWNKTTTYIDDSGVKQIHVPEKETIYEEHNFTVMCSQFKDTPFEIIYNMLSSKYILGRVRIMRLEPKTCLSWHTDSSTRVHYPIHTQEGCLMVIDDEVNHMPSDTWWWADTTKKHTAFNGSKQDRIHVVAVILGER